MSEAMSQGEMLERARRRRKIAIIGGLVAVGFFCGFIAGYRDAEALFEGSGSWPPAMAIGLAAAYLAAVIGGGIALSRQSDEVELQAGYKAVAVAAAAYMLLYPVWYLLWRGALVPEPIHGVIFLIFWISLAGASIFYRFR